VGEKLLIRREAGDPQFLGPCPEGPLLREIKWLKVRTLRNRRDPYVPRLAKYKNALSPADVNSNF